MITLPVALAASGVLAEVFRAGMNAVPCGQTEAALALGMRPFRVKLKIVLPQAIRYVIPRSYPSWSWWSRTPPWRTW